MFQPILLNDPSPGSTGEMTSFDIPQHIDHPNHLNKNIYLAVNNESYETIKDVNYDENRNIKEYFNPMTCSLTEVNLINVKEKFNLTNNEHTDPRNGTKLKQQSDDIYSSASPLGLAYNNNNNENNDYTFYNGTFAMRSIRTANTNLKKKTEHYELRRNDLGQLKNDAKYSLDSLSIIDEKAIQSKYNENNSRRGTLESTIEDDRLNLIQQEKKNMELRQQVKQYRKLLDVQLIQANKKTNNTVDRLNKVNYDQENYNSMPNRKIHQKKLNTPFSPISQNNETSRRQDYVQLCDVFTRSNIEKSFDQPEIPPKPLPRKRYSTLQLSSAPDKNKSIESFQTIDPIVENLSEEMNEEDAEVYHYMSPQFNHRKILSNELQFKSTEQVSSARNNKITQIINNPDFLQYCEKTIKDSTVIPKSEKGDLFMKLLRNNENNGSAFSLQKLQKSEYSTLPNRIDDKYAHRKFETAEAVVPVLKPSYFRSSQDRIFLSAEDNTIRLPYDYYPSLSTTMANGNLVNFREIIDKKSININEEYILRMKDSIYQYVERDIDKSVIVSEYVCAGYLWRMLPQNYTNDTNCEMINGRKRSVSVETSALKNRNSMNSSPGVRINFGAIGDWDQRKYGGRSWAKRFFKIDTKRQLFVYYDNHTKTNFKHCISFADIVGVDKYDENITTPSSNSNNIESYSDEERSIQKPGNFNNFIQESKNFFKNKFRLGNLDESASIFSRGRNRKVDLIIRTKNTSMMLSAPNKDIANIWFELLKISLSTLVFD